MSAILTDLGGSEPFKLDDEPAAAESKPPAAEPTGDLRSNPGGLAEMLAAQALKLKKAVDVKPLAPPREKLESEMTFGELIAWKASRLKKVGEPEAAQEEKKEAPTPPPELVVEEEKKTESVEPPSPIPVASPGMDIIAEDDEDDLEESKLEESKVEEKKDFSPL